MTKEQFWKLRDEQGKAPPGETINGHWSHLEPKCSCGISLRVNWGLVYCPHQPCGKTYTEPHEMPPPPVFVFSCIKCGKFDCPTHSKWESNDQTP